MGIAPFEFATATQIIFGAGRLREVGPRAADLGRRALVVTGARPARAQPLLELLKGHGVGITTFSVVGEPTIETIREGTAAAREARCDLVVGFGGGSAMDAAKAIAAMATNEGDLLDYVEVIGRGRSLTQPSLSCIVIPTTAGTGAEVTRNSVLASPEHRVKVSLRSTLLLPRLALVDPELTYSLPPGVTASSGLDALTQLVEPFVSLRANPLVDGICREGLGRVARSLRRAYNHGDDIEARTDMALASLLSGLALANAGLGAVHGFAGPIGGMFPAPHGAVCGRLLPHVMEANVRLLEQNEPESPALGRYEEAARIVTGRADATASDGVAWVAQLVEEFGIPKLSHYGIRPADIPAVVERAALTSSMKANPAALRGEEMQEILARAL